MPEFQTTDEGFERVSLRDYTEKAYLDYSMYVILDRLCPTWGMGSSLSSGGLYTLCRSWG